jgi:uncharacterized RDD family membrane protein YckC
MVYVIGSLRRVSTKPRLSVWRRRLRAAWVDVLVLAVVFIVLSVVSGGAHSGSAEGSTGASVTLSGGAAVLWAVIVCLYYAVPEAMSGQTLGKRLMGVRVVSANGQNPSLGAVVLRTGARIIDVLPVFYLLGFIVCSIGDQRRRIGDLIAGTSVVDA